MITVVGAGNIGRAIVDFLSEKFDVSVIDISDIALRGIDRARIYKGTVSDHRNVIEKSNIVVTALPGSVSFGTISRILKMGKGVVDVSYMEEDPYLLDSIAKEKRVVFIPDAGFAPGLSNILSGHLYRRIEKIKKLEIYVGGLPRAKIPPLNYTITWSVEGLIDEYTRPARYIRNYRVVSVDPLDTIEPFCISNLGSFETFISDGLRTMLKTFKIKDMFERTLRYPSHMEKIRLLRDLGYFSREKIKGCSPYDITVSLFKKLKLNIEDITILLVRGYGTKNIDLFVYDRYDSEKGITSMARMTGYTSASIAMMALELEHAGVLPPELLGMDDNRLSRLRNFLRGRGIIINETYNPESF